MLLSTVVFIVCGEDFGAHDILRLLSFSPPAVRQNNGKLLLVIYSAVVLDVLVRSLGLSLKIAINIVVPMLRQSRGCRSCADGKLRDASLD